MSATTHQQAVRAAVMAGDYPELKRLLEKAVIEDLKNEDGAKFAKDYDQLEALYLDTNCIKLTFSFPERLCLGLGLMKKLKDDDMQSFHLLLQHCRFMMGEKYCQLQEASENYDVTNEWACLAYPVALERELVNGNLSGVLEVTRQSEKLPDPAFKFLISSLEISIETRVCKAIESAYKKIPLAAAMKLLGLRNEEELLKFIETKMSEMWERSLQKPKLETFGSLATPQHGARVAADDLRDSTNAMIAQNRAGIIRSSSITHKLLNAKVSSGAIPEESIVFESQASPKLWTLSPDRMFVEIIDTAATRTYIPSSDLLKTWVKLTESLEAV